MIKNHDEDRYRLSTWRGEIVNITMYLFKSINMNPSRYMFGFRFVLPHSGMHQHAVMQACVVSV